MLCIEPTHLIFGCYDKKNGNLVKYKTDIIKNKHGVDLFDSLKGIVFFFYFFEKLFISKILRAIRAIGNVVLTVWIN